MTIKQTGVQLCDVIKRSSTATHGPYIEIVFQLFFFKLTDNV